MANASIYRTMREQIADHIRSHVLAGDFNEGQPLREQELAAQFGVSRGPIRDALLQLTQEGLLVAKPNCGVRVAAPPDEAMQRLVIDLRRRIEKHALRRAFSRFDAGALRRLQETGDAMRAACEAGDMPDIVEHDMRFHRLLVEVGGGHDLVALWQPIVVRMMLRYTRHDDPMMIHREHDAILQAIREGDRRRALKALEANIQ